MSENWPFKITIIDKDTGERELQLEFKVAFRELSAEGQGERLVGFLNELAAQHNQLPEGDMNRQGMALVHQVVSALSPRVVSGEVSLDEPVVVPLGNTPPPEPTNEVKLSDLISGLS